jgi:L,D-peptidoglycan transpeptidase YkuD (ErfK/YbiS/YcfS/YnhG family)
MKSRRGRRRFRRLITASIGLVIFSAAVFGVLLLSSAKPPLDVVNQCQYDISRARDVEAAKYAPVLLLSAETQYNLAINEWKYQNARIFFTRNYQKMISLAMDASVKAKEASEQAMHVKDSLQADLATVLKTVEHKIGHYEEYYAHLPLSGTTRQNFTSAKLRFMESKEAYERGDYKQVSHNLDIASQLITKSVTEAHNFLSDYFKDLSKWRRWADETVDWSRKNNSHAIVVDKFAQRLYVYYDGRLKREFVAELGAYWIGAKQYRGDKATPEGKYHITKKKGNRETKYYKAMLINYPNDEDKARYEVNVKKGRIPRRGLGNLIEIHGDGGKGMNWTEGCIALTNSDMDRLFELCGPGTPVTIVGSLKSLQEINGF